MGEVVPGTYRYLFDVALSKQGATSMSELCAIAEPEGVLAGICDKDMIKAETNTVNTIRELWVNFAKTGKPTSARLAPAWTPTVNASLPMLHIATTSSMKTNEWAVEATPNVLIPILCQKRQAHWDEKKATCEIGLIGDRNTETAGASGTALSVSVLMFSMLIAKFVQMAI